MKISRIKALAFATIISLGITAMVPYIMDTETKFDQIMNRAKDDNWSDSSIGKLMCSIGEELIGIPYRGSTLENKGKEICTVDLTGLDCVTFFENTLGMARIIKKGKYDLSDLFDEITYTRYRSGKLTDYTSRLHYTSDWIYDNVKKAVVRDISSELGGKEIQFQLDFMSEHPQYYMQLENNPDFIKTISNIEQDINKRKYHFIPNKEVENIEEKLQCGDIIAIVTSKKGLDYSHTGMIYIDKNEKALFMHASSDKKKVIIDKRISEYLKRNKSSIGISVLRPIEP